MAILDNLTSLVDLVFPPRCPLCGDAISAQAGLCVACWSDLSFPGRPACYTCARPLADALGGGGKCRQCTASAPEHDGIAAATIYNDTSRKLVLAFKHGNRIALAPMMARLMAARLDFVDGDWLAVPVPLHRWRLWRRGYNQAAVLASQLASMNGARLCIDGLVRLKPTPPLGKLGARERMRLMAGTIAARSSRANVLKDANILLVDDVLTSGATSDACIAALKHAGARKVVIACFARVLEDDHAWA